MATDANLNKMEYANDSTDANKLKAIYDANPSLFDLPADAEDANARNCSISNAVDLLYLHTIRGGRKMSGVGELSGGYGGYGSGSDSSSGGCGCGMKGGSGVSSSSDAYMGGCLTCPKGVKNIVRIYATFHIAIPALYKKYKAATAAKSVKPVKPVKPVKKAKSR